MSQQLSSPSMAPLLCNSLANLCFFTFRLKIWWRNHLPIPVGEQVGIYLCLIVSIFGLLLRTGMERSYTQHHSHNYYLVYRRRLPPTPTKRKSNEPKMELRPVILSFSSSMLQLLDWYATHQKEIEGLVITFFSFLDPSFVWKSRLGVPLKSPRMSAPPVSKIYNWRKVPI